MSINFKNNNNMKTVFGFGLIILGLVYGPYYKVPSAVISSYIAVLTILIITDKSKELYRLKKEQKQNGKRK